jgi:hypothetical protein
MMPTASAPALRLKPPIDIKGGRAKMVGALMTPVPSVLAILVCDSVILDSLSRKQSVVGIFDNIHSIKVPCYQPVGFYARMTDAEGEYKFTIRILHLGEEEKIIGGLETERVIAKDRLGSLNLVLNLPPVPFPEFGRYEFQLFANDVFIGRAVINVVKPEVK